MVSGLTFTELIKGKLPELAVAMPMYRSRHTAWLSFESLCKQEDVNFPWELIVVEEWEPNMFGLGRILEYADRLEAAGCCRISYQSLSSWIPLCQKWVRLAKLAQESSKFFLLQSADDFYPPKRLFRAMEAMSLDSDSVQWFSDYRCLLYNLNLDKVAIFEDSKALEGLSSGTCIATLTDIVKRLPIEDKRISVDTWLFQHVKNFTGKDFTVAVNGHDDWLHGFFLQGLNNISDGQQCFQGGVQGIQVASTGELGGCPPDIVSRVRNLRPLAQSWTLRPWRNRRSG